MKQKLQQSKNILMAGVLILSLFGFALAPQVTQAQSFVGGIVQCGKKIPDSAVPSGLTNQQKMEWLETQRSDPNSPYRDCGIRDLILMVFMVVNFLIGMAGLVAVLFIFWGAAQMLFSGGNPTYVQNAKSTIKNAIIGLIMVLLSYLVISYVVGLALPGANTDPLQIFRGYAPDPAQLD